MTITETNLKLLISIIKKLMVIKTIINELISDAIGSNGSANAQAILDGKLPVQIEYKHNNRYYTNEGYQFGINTSLGIHDLTLGYRDMEDSESRSSGS